MKTLNHSFLSFLIVLFFSTSAFSEKRAKADDLYLEGKKHYDNKEFFKAAPLMKKAAEMGHPEAQMHLGKLYYNGWGIKHDHHKALEWHKKAAAQGNAESQKKLKEINEKQKNKFPLHH